MPASPYFLIAQVSLVAVHRLVRWYRDGADLNVKLPVLAVYMGHTGLQGTQRSHCGGLFGGRRQFHARSVGR